MPHSMTAFAQEEQNTRIGVIQCELRSLNSRYLDLQLRLADELRSLETAIRERVSARLRRGRVDCNMRLATLSDQSNLVVDQTRVTCILSACRQIAARMDRPGTVSPFDILNWPGVVQKNSHRHDPQVIAEVMLPLLDRTLDSLIATRQREGAALADRLIERCDAMSGISDNLRQQLPTIMLQQRKRLTKHWAEHLAGNAQSVSESRIEQEIVILVQKSDIAEELDRLDTHLTEVRRLLDTDKAIGRRLDFLLQELNREANTLGSKSISIETSRASVELKILTDQMREQVQNLE